MTFRGLFLFSIFFGLLTKGETMNFQEGEAYSLECDRQDELAAFREEFYLPKTPDGTNQIYFCGHSLGLQPKAVQDLMQQELEAWASLGVEGHFKENAPWYSYHELVRDSLSKLVGAMPEEVVAMNSLTVNLHLMMASFYQPTITRYKILMEAPVFSSDTYAVKSQIRFHGYSENEGLLIIQPNEGENYLRLENLEELLDNQGEEIALVLLSAVNYFNGQKLDIERITKKAHEKGCLIGFDLAHAIGNTSIHLHESDVDFAIWCSYKYLNSGPGAIGGAFVHKRHLNNFQLQRLAGWWGNDPKTRFQIHLQPDFIPTESADGWQLSNPSIFSLVPLRASLSIFDKVTMAQLEEKSVKLTGYLEYLINNIETDKISLITPQSPKERGCMLSIRVDEQPELLMEKLSQKGIICDFRRPNVLRITPIPLYNTFHEVWLFSEILKKHLQEI
jgi:kynureninase